MPYVGKLPDIAEPITSKELAEVAPILPPTELQEEMKKMSNKDMIDMQSIVEMASFLDDEILDDIVSRLDIKNVKVLVQLVPFLSDETLTEISKKIDIADIHDMILLAPLMSEEDLDDFVAKIELPV